MGGVCVGWALVSGVATDERSGVGWCASCLDGVLLSRMQSRIAAGTANDVLLPPNSWVPLGGVEGNRSTGGGHRSGRLVRSNGRIIYTPLSTHAPLALGQVPVTLRPVRRGGEDTDVYLFPPLAWTCVGQCGRPVAAIGGGGHVGTVVLGSDERRPELANLSQFVPSRT